MSGPLAGVTYPVTQTSVTLGRSSENDVVIGDLTISRFHARLHFADGSWSIERVSQKNPLRVDHASVVQGPLAHENQVSLGANVAFRFLLEEPSDSDQGTRIVAQDTQTVVNSLPGKPTVQASPAELGIASLEFIDNTTGEREEYPLVQDVVNVGRDASNDIVLAEDYVADFHFQLTRQNGQWKLVYPHPQTEGTEVGLLVHGQRITGDKAFQATLKQNDSIRIGNRLGAMITLKYRDGRTNQHSFSPLLQVIELEGETIGLGRLPENTIQLNHPQVSAHHAQLVLDDVEMSHRRKNLIRQLSGGQRKRVSIALELLAKPSIFFLDEPTSGLDPGLDRRMMVLLRKLADKGHTIVLVTHATNNINVCDYVCFLAPGGNLAYYGPPEGAKAYFNQPDFAEIYSVLDPGESSQELGLKKAEEFRQSDVFDSYIGEPLSHRPQASSQFLRLTQKQSKGGQRGIFWRQFRLLILRYLELLKNDRVNLAILLLQAPVIGLLLLGFIHGVGTDAFNPTSMLECPTTAAIVAPGGFPDPSTPLHPVVSTSCQRVKDFLLHDPIGQAYAHQRGGVEQALQDFIISGPGQSSTILFIMVFAAIMFGCVNSIREFVKETPIYLRERAVNLGILPYMLSKIVVLCVLCMFQCLILVSAIAILDPYHQSIFLAPFLEIYISVVLASWAGLMIGLAVSALVSNNDRAVSFVPLILLPQVLFSGAIFPLTSAALQYPGMLFPARWAMVALGSSVGLHSDKINGDELTPGMYSYHGTLFSIYSSQEAFHFLWLAWLALLIMIVLLGGAIGIILRRKDART